MSITCPPGSTVATAPRRAFARVPPEPHVPLAGEYSSQKGSAGADVPEVAGTPPETSAVPSGSAVRS